MATTHVKHYFFSSKLGGEMKKREFEAWQLGMVTRQECFDPDKGIPIKWAHALIEYWNADPSYRNRYALEQI